MAGLMEFALYANNQKKAFSWAETKVDLDGESRKEARASAKIWCTLLKLYDTVQPWFDKSWKPGDFELVEWIETVGNRKFNLFEFERVGRYLENDCYSIRKKEENE